MEGSMAAADLPAAKRCTRSSARQNRLAVVELPNERVPRSRRRECGDGRLWLDDIGMILVQHIRSLPCLRILFGVNRMLSFFCRQRFIALNREMEAKISEDVQYMLKNDCTKEFGMENTLAWQLLQVVRMREQVLRANRKVRLDVNSVFEAARLSKIELQHKIDASNQRLQALRDQLAVSKRERLRNPRAIEMLHDAALVADQFKSDTAQLSRENGRAMRAVGLRLRALLRKANRCLRRNLREIDRVTRRCNLLSTAAQPLEEAISCLAAVLCVELLADLSLLILQTESAVVRYCREIRKVLR